MDRSHLLVLVATLVTVHQQDTARGDVQDDIVRLELIEELGLPHYQSYRHFALKHELLKKLQYLADYDSTATARNVGGVRVVRAKNQPHQSSYYRDISKNKMEVIESRTLGTGTESPISPDKTDEEIYFEYVSQYKEKESTIVKYILDYAKDHSKALGEFFKHLEGDTVEETLPLELRETNVEAQLLYYYIKHDILINKLDRQSINVVTRLRLFMVAHRYEGDLMKQSSVRDMTESLMLMRPIMEKMQSQFNKILKKTIPIVIQLFEQTNIPDDREDDEAPVTPFINLAYNNSNLIQNIKNKRLRMKALKSIIIPLKNDLPEIAFFNSSLVNEGNAQERERSAKLLLDLSKQFLISKMMRTNAGTLLKAATAGHVIEEKYLGDLTLNDFLPNTGIMLN